MRGFATMIPANSMQRSYVVCFATNRYITLPFARLIIFEISDIGADLIENFNSTFEVCKNGTTAPVLFIDV